MSNRQIILLGLGITVAAGALVSVLNLLDASGGVAVAALVLLAVIGGSLIGWLEGRPASTRRSSALRPRA